MSQIEWSHMEVLLVICQEQSISRAAKVMQVDQSTLSRRLNALEDQMGQKLFARSKTGAHPTAFARTLLPLAHQMERAMRQVEGFIDVGEEGLSGTVRLTVPEVVSQFFLIPHLSELYERYPGLSLQIETGAKIADMNRLEADLAVRLVRPKTGDLTVRSLLEVELAVVGHRDYLMRRGHLPLEELDWVGWDRQFAGLFESKWLEQRGIEPRLRFNRMLPILEAVQHGLGVAVLGKGMTRTRQGLEVVPEPSLSRAKGNFWLVRPQVHKENALVDVVATWLVELCKTFE